MASAIGSATLGEPVQDYRDHAEDLRKKAAEAALTSQLTTIPAKRDFFAKLAAHLDLLAGEVERAMPVVRPSVDMGGGK